MPSRTAHIWQLVGAQPLFDPPRPDSEATIATVERRGAVAGMVTGDAVALDPETAGALGMAAACSIPPAPGTPG